MSRAVGHPQRRDRLAYNNINTYAKIGKRERTRGKDNIATVWSGQATRLIAFSGRLADKEEGADTCTPRTHIYTHTLNERTMAICGSRPTGRELLGTARPSAFHRPRGSGSRFLVRKVLRPPSFLVYSSSESSSYPSPSRIFLAGSCSPRAAWQLHSRRGARPRARVRFRSFMSVF